MHRMTEDETIAFNCLDPIYVDGIAGMARLAGDNFATFFFRWELSAAGVYTRSPALRVVGPIASITCRSCADIVSGLKKPPTMSGVTAGMH
jgi:hypothetical protein